MSDPLLTTWHTATDPRPLLDIIQPPVAYPATPTPPSASTLRRLQLFGCACARMVWDMLTTDERNAVIVRERFADGRATETDLRATLPRVISGVTATGYAKGCARYAAGYRWGDVSEVPTHWHAGDAARNAAKALATRAAGPVPARRTAEDRWHDTWNATFNAARAHQCELFRDIFPPPRYTPALRPDWRTSTVIALARQMDATGDFSAVPILADALQDAGCDSDTILNRCRVAGGGWGEPAGGSPIEMTGVHCRGNWVVDLVLGRE